MTAILSALASGYTAKQIIDFLLKKGGSNAQKIQSALQAGYSEDDIVRFLSGDYQKQAGSNYKPFSERLKDQPGTTGSENEDRLLQASTNRPSKTMQQIGSFVDPLSNPLVLAALGYGAGKYGGAIAQKIGGYLGGGNNPPGSPSPGTPQPNPNMPPPPQGAVPPLQGTSNPPNTPPNTPPNAPNVPNTPAPQGGLGQMAGQVLGSIKKEDIKDVVKTVALTFGFKNVALAIAVADLAFKTGKKAYDIYTEAKSKGDVSTPEKAIETVKSLEPTQQQTMNDISDFRQKALEGIDMESLSPTRQNRISNVLSQIELLRKEGVKETDPRYKALSKQIKAIKSGKGLTFADKEEERLHGTAKSRPAILKGGESGEIIGSKKGVAEVEMPDGTIRRQKMDDILESPLEKKDLADLHDEMIKGIEEETGQPVSRNVFWAGYDPKNNSLSYIPHDGALYTYSDISPDEAKQLTNVLSLRKTSGGNYIGNWEEGTESPIGAAMSELIQKLQKERGGKGNEYSGKAETLYSAYEPAKRASKAKQKRLKDEEKAKKKK